MKIVNRDSVYDLLENRSTTHRKSMKTNFWKRKMYKNIKRTFEEH
jgi:hypothetical protein